MLWISLGMLPIKGSLTLWPSKTLYYFCWWLFVCCRTDTVLLFLFLLRWCVRLIYKAVKGHILEALHSCCSVVFQFLVTTLSLVWFTVISESTFFIVTMSSFVTKSIFFPFYFFMFPLKWFSSLLDCIKYSLTFLSKIMWSLLIAPPFFFLAGSTFAPSLKTMLELTLKYDNALLVTVYSLTLLVDLML